MLTDAGVRACTADGDVQHYASVPVITDVTVQAYQQMSADDKATVEAGITHILMGNNGLWGINAYAGLVARIDTDGAHILDVAFDTSEWFAEDACPMETPLNGFVEDSTVYILTANTLQVWHTDTAMAQGISIKAIMFQCIPYKEHQALLNVMTSNGDWNTTLCMCWTRIRGSCKHLPLNCRK